MQLIINGEMQEFSEIANLSDLVSDLSLTQKRIAIELNGHIVSRSQFATTALQSHDRLEIVVAVGGG